MEDTIKFPIDFAKFDKDDIDINYEKGYVVIEAHKSIKNNNAIMDYVFKKTVYVGEDVDPKDIKATLENGELRLSLPDPKHDKYKIEIK